MKGIAIALAFALAVTAAAGQTGLGRSSANPYDPESTSNPFGR